MMREQKWIAREATGMSNSQGGGTDKDRGGAPRVERPRGESPAHRPGQPGSEDEDRQRRRQPSHVPSHAPGAKPEKGPQKGPAGRQP